MGKAGSSQNPASEGLKEHRGPPGNGPEFEPSWATEPSAWNLVGFLLAAKLAAFPSDRSSVLRRFGVSGVLRGCALRRGLWDGNATIRENHTARPKRKANEILHEPLQKGAFGIFF